MSFREWMKEVDNEIMLTTGLSAVDLPDCPYRDWYDDGMEAGEAAEEAVAMAQE